MEWNPQQATGALGIVEWPFMNDNYSPSITSEGWANHPNKIAVSEWAINRVSVYCHEMAHVLLGHVWKPWLGGRDIPTILRELEAESVALACVRALGERGEEDAIAYLKIWENRLPWDAEWMTPERTARVQATAIQILMAGQS